MPRSSTRFDFRKCVAYDGPAKYLFHHHARRQLRALAIALGLDPDAYNLRSNRAGPAVSGEITLHADHLYIQVSQPFGGFDTGILFRTCDGRRDYVGGTNNLASLNLLHDPEALARKIRQACPCAEIHNATRASEVWRTLPLKPHVDEVARMKTSRADETSF